MPTIRDIITLALKQAKVIAAGESPSDTEAADGLIVVQSVYDDWSMRGMFGTLTDVYLTEDDDAEEGQRIFAAAGVTVTIPATIDDGTDTRKPRDLACIEVIDGDDNSRTTKIYDARLGSWVSLVSLGLNDEAPLASRSQYGLAACIAIRWGETFGAEIARSILAQALRFEGGLSYKLGSDQGRAGPDYF